VGRKTVVGVLGTLHQEEVRQEFRYPLTLLRELIVEFRPDVICGEVRPEDWERYIADRSYQGYLGPSEYRLLIIPLCEELEIEFVPVDKFEEDLANLDHFRSLSKEEAAAAEKQLMLMYERIFERARVCAIPFNGPEVDVAVREKMEWLGLIDPVVQNVLTDCRNQIMVERIRRAISERHGKRVLCIAGCEHNGYFVEGLRDGDWELVYPLR
jgi:hypothetical protein